MIERAYGVADPGARQPNARSDSDETAGRKAERLVYDRLRAAFPETVWILENVRWRERVKGHFHDGEADLVVADPERGILVVEVKSGEIRRAGRTWWAGNKELPQSPFEQAASSRHALVRKLRELPAWDPTLNPVAGDAVAFPDVDIASAGARLGMLGPDVDPELILDQHRLLGDPASATELGAWLDRVLEGFGRDSAARRPPGEKGVGLLVDLLEEPIELRCVDRERSQARPRVLPSKPSAGHVTVEAEARRLLPWNVAIVSVC